MNRQANSELPENREAILDEINALLGTAGSIDETRAKNVRKAVDALRNSTIAETAVADSSPEDAGEAGSELDARIDTGLETLRERIHKQVERRNSSYEKALQQMDELEAALKDNELQQAQRAYQKLMSIMGNIPGLSEQRWQDIDKRLNNARPRLRKLESWRHWGTTQARQELIEQITQLIDSGLQPEKLARQIQQARDQWHAWDKSGDHAAKELWQTFDQACEQAYKPCIAHFEQLKQRRVENLKQRQAIIEQLNARFESTDWKEPDWREIDKYVSHARREFYKIGNVDFKHRKTVSRALDEALERFEKNLSRERARSLAAREKLIADIEALAGVDNVQEALDQLEALKKHWAVTVTGKRTQENRLWKRFQTACDNTYQRRDAARKEQAAERDRNLKQKLALIEELARIAAAPDEELLANRARLPRIQERWQEIGWIPRKEEKNLENRWREVQKQFRKAVEAAESRAQASELDNLARRAALCSQWEQALLAGGEIAADSVRPEWDALPALGGTAAAAIERRLEQVFGRPDDATLSGNLAAKQDACLRLEVLLDLESPPECQPERMAYQIERLNASLKKDLDAQDAPEDLLLAALTTGAVPAAAAGVIEQRIAHCLARYQRK